MTWESVLRIRLFLSAIIIIGVGLLSKPHYLIHVVGRKPIKIPREELEEIIRIIRQYREKVEREKRLWNRAHVGL